MSNLPAVFLLWLPGIYLGAGFIFAIFFVLKGVSAMDEGAAGAGWGFRLIILPGSILLWPYLFRKWIRAAGKNHKQVIKTTE